MIHRKASFAAPFVFIAASAAAGCGNGQRAESPHTNPPGPERRSPDDCAKIQGGTACRQEHDGACSVPNETNCGIIGWDCIDEDGQSSWKEQRVPCEAPRPGQDVAPVGGGNPPPPQR